MEQVASIAVVKYRSNHEIQSCVLKLYMMRANNSCNRDYRKSFSPFSFEKISTRKIEVVKSFTSILFCLDLLKKSEVD